MPITQDDVDIACEELTAEGKRTTINAVTALVGRGSTGTINGMIKVWKAANADRTALRQTPVPPAIADDMAVSLARLWREAMKQATSGHDAMRQDLLACRAEAEAVEAELIGRVTLLKEALAEKEREISILLAHQATFDQDRAAMTDRVIRAETGKARAEGLAQASAAEARAARQEAASALAREASMREERDAARRDAAARVAAREAQPGAPMPWQDKEDDLPRETISLLAPRPISLRKPSDPVRDREDHANTADRTNRA